MGISGPPAPLVEIRRWHEKLRAYFRKQPCHFGWHYKVLAFDGRRYLTLCEHCNKRFEQAGS